MQNNIGSARRLHSKNTEESASSAGKPRIFFKMIGKQPFPVSKDASVGGSITLATAAKVTGWPEGDLIKLHEVFYPPLSDLSAWIDAIYSDDVSKRLRFVLPRLGDFPPVAYLIAALDCFAELDRERRVNLMGEAMRHDLPQGELFAPATTAA